jgi:xylulose-5-phosphate/fructose-6-phosphate phosphoketolase
LSRWLESYNPRELFDEDGRPLREILSILPEENRRMGQNPISFEECTPLDVPDWKNFVVKKGTQKSCMHCVGELLHDVIAMSVAFCIGLYIDLC